MRKSFEKRERNVGKAALERSGRTAVQYEIAPDTQHAGIWHAPDPAHRAERARLGLLGRMASVHCMIELYAHEPSAEELRTSLGKHLVYWQACIDKAGAAKRRRKASARARSPGPAQEPFLWIVAAKFDASMLKKLNAEPMPGWPAGVYALGKDLLRVGIVVAAELPRERSTLLVRIMAAGPGLPQAIAELSALPPDAGERIVAEGGLVRLYRALAKARSRTPEEEKFVASMRRRFKRALEASSNAEVLDEPK